MGLQLVYAPQVEPVDLDELKAYCGVDDGDADWDTQLRTLLKSGRERAERITGKGLINQQWRLNLKTFPAGSVFELPLPPLNWDTVGLVGPPAKAVDSIKYLDVNNNLQTVATTEYTVDTTTTMGTIRPAYLKYWPTSLLSGWNIPNAVQVLFTAGYGATADTVPAEIRERIKDYVKYCFDRGGIDSDQEYLDRLFAGLSCGSFYQTT